MSELTVTLLQFGFLALLWLFIAAVVFSQARDLSVSGKARSRSRGRTRSAVATEEPSGRRAEPSAAATPVTGGSRHRPQQLVVLDGPLAGSSYQLGAAPVMLGRSPRPPFRSRTTTPRAATPACSRRAHAGSWRTSAPPTARSCRARS